MQAAMSVRSACEELATEVRILPSAPDGDQFAVLHSLVAEVAVDSLAGCSSFYWVSVDGLPLLVPAVEQRVAVNPPSESQNHAVEVPPVIAGILVAIFALEYGVFTDSGSRRTGLAATILAMKYQYINLLRSWAAAQVELGDEVLEMIE